MVGVAGSPGRRELTLVGGGTGDVGYLIRIAEPGDEPRTVEINRSVEVGRQVSGVRVFDPSASRRHLRLDEAEGGLVLTDLGSSYGTFVNGHRVTQPVLLRAGDSIQFGNTSVTLVGPTQSAHLESTIVPMTGTHIATSSTPAGEPIGYTPPPPVPGTSVAAVVTPPPPIDPSVAHASLRRTTPPPVDPVYMAQAPPGQPAGPAAARVQSEVVSTPIGAGFGSQAAALIGARVGDVALLLVLAVPGLAGLAVLPFAVRDLVDDAVVNGDVSGVRPALVALVLAFAGLLAGWLGTAWVAMTLRDHVAQDLLGAGPGPGAPAEVVVRAASGIASLCRETVVGLATAIVGAGVALAIDIPLGLLLLAGVAEVALAAWLGDRTRRRGRAASVAGVLPRGAILLSALVVVVAGAWMATDGGTSVGTLVAELMLVPLVLEPVAVVAGAGHRRDATAAALGQIGLAGQV